MLVRFQSATQVVEAKAGAGSATLSMAAAAAEFADACMRGLQGEPGVVACAYVESSLTELPFFASKCVQRAPGNSFWLASDCATAPTCVQDGPGPPRD